MGKPLASLGMKDVKCTNAKISQKTYCTLRWQSPFSSPLAAISQL